MNKFMRELDCVSLINSIRELKSLQKMIMSEHQVILNRFNKNHVLAGIPNIGSPDHLSIENNIIKPPLVDSKKNLFDIESYEMKIKEFTDNLKSQYSNENDQWFIDQVISSKENLYKM